MSNAASEERVCRMCELQAHRDPDMHGLWQSGDGACTFGHRRLSIIDLSESGRQPMVDRSVRFHLTFYGEIYNYKYLRSELQSEGVVFRTLTDTEVLLEGFARHGQRFLARVDGMFLKGVKKDVSKKR